MTPSPTTSDRSARLVRELSRDLSRSRNSHFAASPSALEHEHTHNSNIDTKSSSEFDPGSDEIFMSTRQLDDTAKQLPNIRSTAKKYAYYNPPQPEPRVDTSMLQQEFQGFDQDVSLGEESMSIEMGRGGKRSLRNTPSKINQSSIMSPNPQVSIGDDSLYEVTGTPGNRPRLSTRNTDGAERGSLRKEASIRRAASLPQKDIEASLSRLGRTGTRLSPSKAGEFDRRRSTLADMHAKVTSEESLLDERPPTLTMSVKNTRFNHSRSRQTSAAPNGLPSKFTSGQGLDAAAYSQTPQRAAIGTPRAAANVTQQSFMLPDLPNLTELVSGVYKDGTPVFSRGAKARSRFTSGSYPNRSDNGQPNHIPVESIPVPADEKAIFASLQLLKEKVAQLEQEKAESERRIEDYENEAIELKAELQMQQDIKRSDSALGSTDGEGRSGKDNWRVEKTKLESSIQSLQNRLDRAERKTSVSDIATKRITQERDSLVTQLGVAFYNQEELKSENEALGKENETFRGEVDALRAENYALRSENQNIRLEAAEIEAQFQDEMQRWNTKEAELRKVGKTDRAALAENETLRAELLLLREQHDEDTQHWTRKEAELRKTSDKKVKAEHAKLQSQNDELKAQLAEAKAGREAEIRRWNSKEAEMRSKIERRDETIRQFEEVTQEEINETLRQHNDNLRVELARFKAQRDSESQQGKSKGAELREQLAQILTEREQETQQWSRKEGVLRGKIERREEALRDMQDMTREVLTTRNANSRDASQDLRSDEKQIETTSKSRSSSRRGQGDSRTKTSSKVEEEVRNSRKASSSRLTSGPSSEKRTQDVSVSQPGGSRFRPERPSGPAAGKLSRRSSAQNIAQAQDVHSASDSESTTDLDLLRNKDRPDTRTDKATVVVGFATSTESPAMDVTYLSFMDVDEIAKLRKALEQERAAARKRAAIASSPQQRQNDTAGPSVSTSATKTQALPRKSSLKDVTGGLKSNEATKPLEPLDAADDHIDHLDINPTHNDVEESQLKQDTSQSILSNSSRRRSTAPIEMTSAFILPDITIHQPALSTESQAAVSNLSPHDAKNCTVCRRTTCNGDHNDGPIQLDTNATATAPPLAIPIPVLVSSRPAADDDIDATLRPAQPPATALATVLKELEDELAHLKLELARQEAVLRAHDPALGKRRRKGVQLRIRELLRMIDLRADQIYALYDVVEGQKDEGRVAVDVEDTLQSLGIEVREGRVEKGRGKRVVIESVGGSEGEESGAESGGEELPWEGISDAESVASERGDRRRSVEY